MGRDKPTAVLSNRLSTTLGQTGAKWGLGARKVNIEMREDVHLLRLDVEDAEGGGAVNLGPGFKN